MRAQDPNNEKMFDEKYSACYPPKFGQMNELRLEENSRGIYSPGVCPSGWTSWSATTSTSIYACCPKGFEWKDWQACKSLGTTATILAINENTNKTIQPPYSLLDWPFIIAWASSDLNKFTPASAPLVLTESTGGPGSSSGLSTGEKAGIGVGVAVGCIALIALLIFLLIFRRRHRQRQLAEVEQNRDSWDQRNSTPPPGYKSPTSPMVSYAKVAPAGVQSPGGASELSSEKEPAGLSSPRPLSLAQSSSELEVPTVAAGVTARELDSRQVYEAHGYPVTPQQYAISNDELGELGLAPVAGRRGYSGGVRRGPSSASAASMYSEDDPAHRGGESSSIPGSTMAGRWSDNSSYGYGPPT